MKARMSQQLTLLGLGAMAFYGIMLSSGMLTVDVMPHFLVSAVIFLTSGRLIRLATRSPGEQGTDEVDRPKRPEPDWPWLTALLNWTAAMLVVGAMAIILMKPPGVSFLEAISHTSAPAHFSAEFVP